MYVCVSGFVVRWKECGAKGILCNHYTQAKQTGVLVGKSNAPFANSFIQKARSGVCTEAMLRIDVWYQRLAV